ncbi:MAG: ABC transporter ATP-binding protein/permease [Clostridiales bacterium]|nr:ABC transporter ATP-binding protein/permease [Clostridiales bacterium]
MLKRFIAYYRPHRKMFILDMLASLLISVIGMIYPIFSRTMLNDLIPNHRLRLLVIYGLTLLALYAVRMLLRYFVQFYGHMVGVGMQAQMRSDMFNKLETLPYSFYDEHETGKIMSRMTNDLMDVSELAHHGPENLLISGIMIVGSFVYLCTISVPLTLIIFACVPVMAAVSLFCRKRMRDAFTESRKSIAVINAALESSISGIRVTKAFTNADKEAEKFEKGNAQFVEARKKAYRAMAQFFSSTSFITDVFNVVVMLAGGLFMYAGKINFGDYSAFIVSVNQFIGPVTTLINFMEQYQNGVTGFERFLEIMDEQPEQESPNARNLQNVQGEITLDHVSFSYDNSKEVLKDVSLNIKKGETLALVGPSGGGKTTICHLIPAFYKATGGRILIDGTDINDVTFKSLRRSIGIVQQDVFLFNGSIKENILYGRLDATDGEVIEAAKRANIHDYVMTLPDGYDTQIGERGVKLSGGQKQRLSIARVFLKNPAILILDEATSALDNTTEILIQQALDELCKGRTTLVVAHRLSTIKNADEICVIANGQITEMGTHEALMEKGGVYHDLYSLQFRSGESDHLQFLMQE